MLQPAGVHFQVQLTKQQLQSQLGVRNNFVIVQ